ncbi:hypothetical protein OAH21_01820, partial [bacterium]|nr:hypothetical protein [bacterium]
MRKSFVFLGSLVLGLCGLAQGDLNDGRINVESYFHNSNPSPRYPDSENVELTDGLFPSRGWGGSGSPSNKQPWVGYLFEDADISFHFEEQRRIKTIKIFADDANGKDGVSYPNAVTVTTSEGYEKNFTILNPTGSTHSQPIILDVDTIASEVSLIVENPPSRNGADDEWIMLSEVEFFGPAVNALRIIEGNFTWQEAKADAEAKGGRLAVLDTQEKIDAANAYLEELGEWPNTWIGATDEVTEGDWRWIDGTALTAENWYIGEPNNAGPFGPEHNAHYIANIAEWNDSNSSSRYSYLLEILVQEPAPPFVELDSFYESNPLEEIVVDATPSEGFPDTFTYQWSFNDQPIPAFLGGAQPTFSLLGDQSQDGTWKVVVSNTVGTTEASFEYRVFVDNDSDGLSNYHEENFTLTNPDLADSDSDGLSDPDELSIHGTDPNIADVDEDGLNDSEEIAATTDPSVADTDNDGLSDGAEVKTYASNPKSRDTDNDGIADAAELAAGLDINTAESIADAVAFLTQELANRPPVDGFEDALIEARASGRNDVTTNPSQYDLYDKATYDAVVADRDARPTLAEYALIVEDRDSRPTLQAYNAVVADRDSRPTKEVHDAVIAERDA